MTEEFSKRAHSLLARQLRRAEVTPGTASEPVQRLLETVNEAYRDFDGARQMLERSLELSSRELRQANDGLRALLAQRDENEKQAAAVHSQRLEATGLLAGGVAHDFNNLLTVIKTSCDLLLSTTPADDARRAFMLQIETAAKRATELTRQLLIFSRQQVQEPQTLDLNRTIADLEQLYRPLIGRAIELRYQLEPGLPCINADPAQIEQVLLNLIVNARDAMPSGGTLQLETRRAAAEEAPAAEAGGGELVRLSVKDNGAGMSASVQTRIFQPFFTTKAPGKGTGLGLSTVYGIVRQSGGFITVESEIAKGTTFHVFLPTSDGLSARQTT